MTRYLLSALFFVATTSLVVVEVRAGRNFTLRDDISGNGFFDAFTWWDYADPTHGFVDYVSQSDAQKAQLSYVDSSTGRFVMRADDTTTFSVGSGTGRKSVRIHSKNTMGDGIVIAKVSKMPTGCATWPALWTCTRGNWPSGGEIDIVEGANDQGPTNLASLHTSDGCSIPGGIGYGNRTSVDAATKNATSLTSGTIRLDSGTTQATYCTGQPGCSVRFSGANSYASSFNDNGGGWFVMTRDTVAGGSGISVYFWPASASPPNLIASSTAAPYLVIPDVNASASSNSLTTSSEGQNWGYPAAHFPNNASTCDMQKYYGQHEIIINLSLCGDWAGETFGQVSACQQTGVSCEAFVALNPSAFTNARWEIDYLRVYTDSAFSAALLSKRGAFMLLISLAVSAAMLLI